MPFNNLRILSVLSRASGVLVLTAMGLGAWGCATKNSTVLRAGPTLGSVSSVATSADIRLITVRPAKLQNDEYLKPTEIICSEPSPDVAKIVSTAFDSGFGLLGKVKVPNVPTDIDLKTTLALSKSYVEGLAQMTERLATIQLLRDGLYRACEAYTNGAISATTYAAIVSRFDATMITMLMGELVAGNFGRSLAALGASASGKASAELAFDEVRKRERDAKTNLEDKKHRKEDIQRQLQAQPAGGVSTDQEAALTKRLAEADDDLIQAREEHQQAEDQLKQTLKAMVESSAETTVTAAGSIPRTPAEAAVAIAGDLVQMQANYLNDHNVDALKIACISSLGREPLLTAADLHNQPNVTARGDGTYRYNYQRALSVWCDELTESLKQNERAIFKAKTELERKVPASDIMQLVVPRSHAVGPFGPSFKDGQDTRASSTGKGP